VATSVTKIATPMVEYDGIKGGKYFCIQTMLQFREFMVELRKQKVLAVDTETSGLDWVQADACGIVIGWGVANNYYLPIDHKGGEKQLDIENIRADLSEVFEDETVSKIFWNAKFDQHFLRKLGLEIRGVIHDGVVLVHLMDENSEKGLKPLSNKHLGKDADKWEGALKAWRVAESSRRRKSLTQLIKDDVDDKFPELEAEYMEDRPFLKFSGLTKAQQKAQLKKWLREKLKDHPLSKNKLDDISYDYVPLEIIAPYACADVHYTWLLYKRFLIQVAGHNDLKNLYINEMSLSALLFEVEHAGLQIDELYLKRLEPDFAKQIRHLEQDIYKDVGFEFNLESTNDLAHALKKAGCKLNKMTKKSKDMIKNGEKGEIKYSVDNDVLESLAAKYPFAFKIMEYRKLKKLMGTYVINIRNLTDENGFLHPTFNANVSTGRMSSREPNVQNIPGRDTSIRRAFILPKDEEDLVFVFIDYSQVELRLTAHHSMDPALLQCYPRAGKGIDVHSLTCAEVVMGITYDELLEMKEDDTGHDDNANPCNCRMCFVKFKRNIAKRVNFGIIYGAQEGAIQKQVSTPARPVSESECKEYIDKYFDKYVGVKNWIATTKRFMRKHGYLQNTFGRYRRLPGIKAKEKWQQERAERQGTNFLIQGDAADLFKTACVRVDNFLKERNTRTRIVNFVHDEIQFYWAREELHLLKEVKALMEDFDFAVPIIAEVSWSPTDWATKKDI